MVARSSEGRYRWALALTLLFAAAAIRLIGLVRNDLWIDELYSLDVAEGLARGDVQPLWLDPHPPLFYLFVTPWVMIAGTSETSLHLLPAVIGTLTVPLTYLWLRQRFGDLAAFASAVVLCVLPLHVAYSQNLRMYGLGYLFATLVMLALLAYVDAPTRGTRWRLAVACGALIGTHYGAGAFAAAAIIMALVAARSSNGERLRLVAAVVVCAAPFVPQFLLRMQSPRLAWIPPLAWDDVGRFAVAPFHSDPWLVAVVVFVIAFGTWDGLRAGAARRRFVLVMWGLWGAATVVLALLSLARTAMLPRLALLFAPVLIALCGLGIAALAARTWRRVGALIAVLVIVVAAGRQLPTEEVYSPDAHGDCRAAVRTLADLHTRQPLVVIGLQQDYVTWLLRYYYNAYGLWPWPAQPPSLAPDAVPGHDYSEATRAFVRDAAEQARAKGGLVVVFQCVRPSNDPLAPVLYDYLQLERRYLFHGAWLRLYRPR